MTINIKAEKKQLEKRDYAQRRKYNTTMTTEISGLFKRLGHLGGSSS